MVFITCPYGIRATGSDNIGTTKLAMFLESTTETTMTDDSLASVRPKMMSQEYEDGYSIYPSSVPSSVATTTHAEWEGGSFSINRKARNVELPQHDHKSNPVSPALEVNDGEAQLRLIAANLRGSLGEFRGFQQGRQHTRVGQVGKDEVSQTGIKQNSQLHAGERPFRLSQLKGRTSVRTELPQIRDTPVTEALIGERFVEEKFSVVTQFKQVENETVESSLFGEMSDNQPRVEENHFDLHSVQPNLEITDSEHMKKMVNNSEELTIEVNDPTPPKVEKRFSENIKEKDFTGRSGGGYDFSEKLENGETLTGITSRTVKKSIDLSESKKSHNEHLQSSKMTNAATTVGTSHEVVKFKEDISVNSNEKTGATFPSSLVQDFPPSEAFRSCLLLPSGTVVWKEPDTWKCREKSMQAAEDAAKEVANLTASPATIDSHTFAHAAKELARIVEHALHDPAVANNMVSALSNMMEVNDSVVAAGNEKGNVTSQLVKTINTFVEKVPVDVGKSVKFRSSNLIVEARLLESSASDDLAFHPELEVGGNSVDVVDQSRRKRNTNTSSSAQSSV